MKRTTVIYHSADYDGIFCREIAKKFLGTEGVSYIGWNFGDPPIPVPTGGETFVMDLPLDKPFGRNSLNFAVGGSLVWIDHHKSAIESHPKDIPGYRIDGVAACRLAWQWFSGGVVSNSDTGNPPSLPSKHHFIDRVVSEPIAVRLAGEYDVWDHRGWDLEFQFGLDSQPSIDWESLLQNDDTAEDTVFNVVRDGHAAMRCYAKRDADVMLSRSFMVEWEGLRFLCLNTARCNSNTFVE